MPFPPLFDYYDVSKCEIRFERIPDNYILRVDIPLFYFISHGTAKTKLATLAFVGMRFLKTLFVSYRLIICGGNVIQYHDTLRGEILHTIEQSFILTNFPNPENKFIVTNGFFFQ